MNVQKEYYAFISYKREDEKWAKWLPHELESYNLPIDLNEKVLPKNLRPVFRDTDKLSPEICQDKYIKHWLYLRIL